MDYGQLITDAANAYGVDPAIAVAVALHESGGNQYRNDGSLVRGRSGEIGIFQLMPATALALGVKHPEDAAQNIDGGVRYLAAMYQRYGDWKLALAAYNAGPGNVDKYINGDFNAVPQSSWTYAASILSDAGVQDQNLTPSVQATMTFPPAPQYTVPGTEYSVNTSTGDGSYTAFDSSQPPATNPQPLPFDWKPWAALAAIGVVVGVTLKL
jgi:soluble lytic murein transglycosylase-like protein